MEGPQSPPVTPTTPTTVERNIQSGSRIGPYTLESLLGQGAMGIVWRAHHERLDRAVAIKIIQEIAPDPQAADRFLQEARAVARMRHSNILTVFDFGDVDGMPFMVTELVPGGPLSDRLRAAQGGLTRDDAVRILSGIARGLDYAHTFGVVHRDIKPANVLLENDGSPVIADFGLAKLLLESTTKTRTDIITGTPSYMAPEQIRGGVIGPATDLYALAALSYEVLTGRVPFSGATYHEVLYGHLAREAPTPSSLRQELGARVDGVLLRGLAKTPEERWPSCQAMVAALAEALGTNIGAIENSRAAVDATIAAIPRSELSGIGPIHFQQASQGAVPKRPAGRIRSRIRAIPMPIRVASLLATLIAVVLVATIYSLGFAQPFRKPPSIKYSSAAAAAGLSKLKIIEGLRATAQRTGRRASDTEVFGDDEMSSLVNQLAEANNQPFTGIVLHATSKHTLQGFGTAHVAGLDLPIYIEGHVVVKDGWQPVIQLDAQRLGSNDVPGPVADQLTGMLSRSVDLAFGLNVDTIAVTINEGEVTLAASAEPVPQHH